MAGIALPNHRLAPDAGRQAHRAVPTAQARVPPRPFGYAVVDARQERAVGGRPARVRPGHGEGMNWAMAAGDNAGEVEVRCDHGLRRSVPDPSEDRATPDSAKRSRNAHRLLWLAPAGVASIRRRPRSR